MEPDEVAAAREALAEDCRAVGRDPADVPVSMYASIAVTPQDTTADARQFPLMGSVEQIADTVRAYRAAGLDHLVFAGRGLNTLAEHIALFETIQADIL